MSVKSGPEIPGWVAAVIAAVLVAGLVIVGYKFINGSGPRDPSTYPKEAFQNPYAGMKSTVSAPRMGPGATSTPSSAPPAPGGGSR